MAKRRLPLEGGATFSLRHRAYRAIWAIAWFCLAAWTPRVMAPWRRFWLRAFGAKVANHADVRGSARVWYPANLEMGEWAIIAGKVNCYNMAPVRLGARALVSQGAELIAGTHDVDTSGFDFVGKPIEIGPTAWIAWGAMIGPGVAVGEGAVLGARSVAFSDLKPWMIYVGNPARPVRERRRGGEDE